MTKKILPPRIETFPATKQRRLDDLLEKSSEGTITPREKSRLERLVAEAEQLMVANASRLAKFTQRKGSPAGAVPVTVWVQAPHAVR